jgi:predicted nucleic acid-binding protein
MATRVADRLVLDTNILLAATDQGRAEHLDAVTALNEWPTSGTSLYTTGQIMREYLSVATRPVQQNGLGLARTDAVANVRAMRTRMRFLPEHDKVNDRLLELIERVECTGKQVHDANLVATVLMHGLNTIVTMNTDDFARFADHVRVIGLGAPAS